MATHYLRLQETKLKPSEFIIDGQSMFKQRILISTQPETLTFAPQVDFYTFKSRNGYLAVNYNTRQSKEIKLELSLIASNISQLENSKGLLQSFANGQPHRFRFYHDPFCEYEGVVTDLNLQGNRVLRHNKKAEMTINLQPFRYANSKPITLSNGDRVVFEYGQLMPVFKIQGTGNVDIKTSNTTALRGLPSGTEIVINTIEKATYQQRAGVRVYRGDLKGNYNYPEIKSNQPITWTGNVSRMILEPNWVL